MNVFLFFTLARGGHFVHLTLFFKWAHPLNSTSVLVKCLNVYIALLVYTFCVDPILLCARHCNTLSLFHIPLLFSFHVFIFSLSLLGTESMEGRVPSFYVLKQVRELNFILWNSRFMSDYELYKNTEVGFRNIWEMINT